MKNKNVKKKSGVSESRRNMLKGLAVLPFIGSFSIASAAVRILSKDNSYLTEEAKASLKNLKGVLPKGKLGKYEISRLVLGCNPMGGWSHSRDLPYVGQLSKHWHTDTKMKETWAIAEQAGINFCNLVEFQYKTFNEFKKETGSKMVNNCQSLFGQPDAGLLPLRKLLMMAPISFISRERMLTDWLKPKQLMFYLKPLSISIVRVLLQVSGHIQ